MHIDIESNLEALRPTLFQLVRNNKKVDEFDQKSFNEVKYLKEP